MSRVVELSRDNHYAHRVKDHRNSVDLVSSLPSRIDGIDYGDGMYRIIFEYHEGYQVDVILTEENLDSLRPTITKEEK